MPANLSLIIAITLIIFAAAATLMSLRRDLMMFQQNSYRPERYRRWAKQSHESTSFRRLLSLVAMFIVLVNKLPFIFSGVVATLIAAGITVNLITKKYKKPLVMTARARRIFLTALVLVAVTVCVPLPWLVPAPRAAATILLATLFVSPLYIIIANLLLTPVEKAINRKYYNQAVDILRGMPDMKIIGITGSYGKTSTKHYLHRILSEQFDTLMTPGSFNTPMGVIRTIREHLKPYNEVFIVEMGAKQPGDIKEICDLVKPQMGIITAVGEQHLESFKSIENVQRTKFELADAIPADGVVVLNNDFPFVANRQVTNCKALRYAVSNTEGADYTVKDIEYLPTGSTFTIVGPDGKELKLKTALVGECNISNLMAACIIAMQLGMDERKIQYAVERIEQVEHRLNMKRTPGGVTIIDDAFNSNPDGSRMAMDVLRRMTQGRRIVVTPGMIELGEKQFELNRALGETIGKSVDIAIIVGQYNRDALTEGIKSTGFPEENLHTVASFADSQKLLATMLRPGDTVLYENDLPDTFK
ncbi:MAG: UDP-N-acetylmuramoyl-tripeptide--D-alanyl-D-alanine ligase [Muribaculaceae bacterium]|nr:UDP-N-acetylmuramoyl-tripeptide--D-alanyl-D-alanine ligase [Muribaculaceae bacterium]